MTRFVSEAAGGLEVPLQGGLAARRSDRDRSQWMILGEPPSPLGEEPVGCQNRAEHRQVVDRLERQLNVAGGNRPGQRGAKVVQFTLDAVPPLDLVRPSQA